MELGMTGDVAVVTQGASGIGWACARSLSREGCSVALWDLSPEVEEKAAASLISLAARLAGKTVDISAGEAVQSAMRETEAARDPSRISCMRARWDQANSVSLYQPGTG